jgi:type IV pilus assembly protein PilF
MIRFANARRNFALLLCGIAFAGALAGMSGCTTTPVTSASAPEAYTESDEPQTRKRAANRLRLAVLYFQEGKNSIALDEVKQAINADPNWFEAYNMRGLIYMRMSDYALADASFQKALSINSGSAEVKHNYGVMLCKQNRTGEALRMFSAAIATPGYNQRANTWMEQGVCQIDAGQKSDAELSFTKSYEIDPGNPASGFNLGSLLFQRGETVKAQFYIRRINNGEYATADSLWLGVKIERRLGNSDAVAQLGGQLRKRFPQSTQASAYERSAFDE